MIVLSDTTFERLKIDLDKPVNPGTPETQRYPARNWQLVRIEEGAADCGYYGPASGFSDDDELQYRYYPAIVELWDADGEEEIDRAEVWLLERHNYPLVVGNSYMAVQCGTKAICDETRVVFVTAIGVAGIDPSAAYGSSTMTECEDSGESEPGGSITIPFEACDDDGNPCEKNLVINSPMPLSWCIQDPNDCNAG